MGSINFVAPSAKEPSLVYTVTEVPASSLGQIVFGDGTVAAAGQTYTLAQLQSATFVPALNGLGQGTFTFTVAGFNPILNLPDPAALTETVAITVKGIATGTADQFYVAQLYRDLLGRNADANGLVFWASTLNVLSNRAEVVAGIEHSNEYRADQIAALYQEFLHRAADSVGLSHFLSTMASGETLEQVEVDILSSPEYFQTRGHSTNAGYVDALYTDLLDRHAESAGESFWTNLLSSNAGRSTVAHGIANSGEALQIVTSSLYQEFLRRTPDASGLDFNVDFLLNSGRAAVVANLAGSDEYFNVYGNGIPPSRAALEGIVIDSSDSGQNPAEEGNAVVTTGFPSVGMIDLGGQGIGGGTLIAPMFVLTAAHVVDGHDPSTLTFTVGGATYTVARVVENPGYDPSRVGQDGANDIAILELTRSVTNVAPSPINRTAPVVGDLLTLVGYGARDGQPFGVKHAGTTPLDGISGQLLTWTFDNNSEDDTVVGDSGAPEFIERDGVYYIASVTSGGTQFDSSFGDEPFNTRVDVYQNWIDQVAGLKSSV